MFRSRNKENKFLYYAVLVLYLQLFISGVPNLELNFWNMEINILCILQCHGAALFLKISFSILNSDIILKKSLYTYIVTTT